MECVTKVSPPTPLQPVHLCSEGILRTGGFAVQNRRPRAMGQERSKRAALSVCIIDVRELSLVMSSKYKGSRTSPSTHA